VRGGGITIGGGGGPEWWGNTGDTDEAPVGRQVWSGTFQFDYT
jgi:hypothetical protein